MVIKVCKDCRAEGFKGSGKVSPLATFPGPRCEKHWKVEKKRQAAVGAAKKAEANFGLGEGGYARLLAAQGGCCGGCGVKPGPRAKRMAVDHDHKCCPGSTSCGKCVRGLLCYRCNDTLAKYRDNGEQLRSLARYLDEWPAMRATI